MLRSSEDILLEFLPRLPSYVKPLMIKAVNQAQKEAIEECAKRAKVETSYLEKSQINVCRHKVDKESILSLINELK